MNNKLDKFDYDGKYNEKYYNEASVCNANFDQDILFKHIIKFIKPTDKICEFGCGDGSKLMHLKKYAKYIYGFDLSNKAISKARKNLPYAKLSVSDNGYIYGENTFDTTLCMYTLEHVANPEQFIKEMIRATKKKGYIIISCPNFGSPLFPSPPLIHNKHSIQKIIIVLKRMLFYYIIYKNTFYRNIKPILDKDWQSDFDTISEVSLEKLVGAYKNKVVYASSFWPCTRLRLYAPFYLLAKLSDTPIRYWGPLCFLVLKK